MSIFPSQTNFVTGDILTATAVNEIGQAINLLDGAQFAAGKNKIINGDFAINQRNFSSTTTNAVYTFDRWLTSALDGTTTYTAQTFTTGTAPVAGYEGKNFLRIVTTGQTLSTALSRYTQKIEDVRTFAGQTVTFSFWARVGSGTASIASGLTQDFGTGGSPSAAVNVTAPSNVKQTITTSWSRYSATYTVPSISGKTLGTDNNSFLNPIIWVSAGSNFNSRTDSLGIQTGTFEIWGVQIEAANTASPFQTATGTLQGELAACQRYYYQFATGSQQFIGNPVYYATSSLWAPVSFPVTMRTAPALVASSGTNYYRNDTAGTVDYFNSFTIYKPSTTGAFIYNATEALGVAGYSGLAFTDNASASIAFNSEL